MVSEDGGVSVTESDLHFEGLETSTWAGVHVREGETNERVDAEMNDDVGKVINEGDWREGIVGEIVDEEEISDGEVNIAEVDNEGEVNGWKVSDGEENREGEEDSDVWEINILLEASEKELGWEGGGSGGEMSDGELSDVEGQDSGIMLDLVEGDGIKTAELGEENVELSDSCWAIGITGGWAVIVCMWKSKLMIVLTGKFNRKKMNAVCTCTCTCKCNV